MIPNNRFSANRIAYKPQLFPAEFLISSISQLHAGIHAGKVAGASQQLSQCSNIAWFALSREGPPFFGESQRKSSVLCLEGWQKPPQFRLNPHSESWCVSAPR